jgi:hypothetical protein
MAVRDIVLNVVLCMLLFAVGFMWHFYFIFYGEAGDRLLVIKVLLFVGAIILALQAVKFAIEGEYCFAAVLDIIALLMVLSAVYGL